jgi:hypothetical protein
MTKIEEMDWAVAVVAAMQLPYEALRIGKDDEVAAALRKAKASGMREAKTVIREFHDGRLLNSDQLDTELALWELLDIRANAIESPTT